MSRFNIFFIIIFFIVAGFLWLSQGSNWSEARIKLGGNRLHVLVAETQYQQKKGLGGRSSLKDYDGMLFQFFPAYRVPMVMRNMKFPIDIVWLYDGKVVDIEKNVQPEPNKEGGSLTEYQPDKKANIVIELKSGLVDKYNIKPGDKLKLVK